MSETMTTGIHPDPARAARLRLLALASRSELETLVERLPAKPNYVHVRKPETEIGRAHV